MFKCHVGKVSTIFEFFASGFAFRLGLALYLVGLYAELNSASNGAIFEWGHRAKNSLIFKIVTFLRTFPKVFRVRIRSLTWVGSTIGWVEFRIQFCVE